MSEASGTVARALAVLRALAEAPGPVGVKDLADTLGLPMSTSHRLLDLLSEGGFVEKKPSTRRYGPGPEFFRVANLVVRKASLPERVQPILERLRDDTGETVMFALYLPAQHAVTYAAIADSRQALRFRVDLFEQASLVWGSSGLAVLAGLPEGVQAEVIAEAGPSPTGRIVDREALAARLAETRRNGYAVSQSDKLPNGVGIAAPLEVVPGTVAGSVVLAIPDVRFDPRLTARYGLKVRAAAASFLGREPRVA